MDKHKKEFEQYIKSGSLPGSYSPFLQDCKDVYDKRCQDFKAMLDRLDRLEVDTVQLIINVVNPKINMGRPIVDFVLISNNILIHIF